MRRLRWYPDSRIVADCPGLPTEVVAFGRLPVYSGATVPALDRLPARKRERQMVQRAGGGSWLSEAGTAVCGKVTAFFLGLGLALQLAGCAGAPSGRVAPPLHARRIVALMPSFAEDLCAMGAQAQIVGVSQYGRSAKCAAQVPAVANFASLDAEKILTLHPDAVVAIPAQRALTASLRRTGIQTIFLKDDSYADIFANIRSLGSLSGHRREAEALVAKLQQRTHALRNAERFARRPSVFVVLQAQPIWTVGPKSYISTLLDLAGARNGAADLSRAYGQYSAEALIRMQPDAIVAGGDTQLPSLLAREPWRSLSAVRQNHVFILPDPGLLERPGPRYNEGLSWLIEHLRPLAARS